MKSLDVLINNTSKWIKCLRKIAWLQKFIQWIDEKKKNPQSPDVEKKITLEDLENARRKVIKLVQRQTFNEEIAKLLKEHSTKNILRCKQEIVLTLGYLRSLKREFFLGKEELLIEVCKIPYRTTPCCLSQADA